MYMLPDEYEVVRSRVAARLRALERALLELTQALAHGNVFVAGTAGHRERDLRAVCDAYSAIDLAMTDVPNQSVVTLGVVGVDRPTYRLAEQINTLKAELRAECAPLQRIRRRVVRREGGTEAVPVVRAILRSIQRSDLNLLAAYRKLPILGATPVSISYTRARTRAVYRKTVEQIGDLLQQNHAPAAIRDGEDVLMIDNHMTAAQDLRNEIAHAALLSRGFPFKIPMTTP